MNVDIISLQNCQIKQAAEILTNAFFRAILSIYSFNSFFVRDAISEVGTQRAIAILYLS